MKEVQKLHSSDCTDAEERRRRRCRSFIALTAQMLKNMGVLGMKQHTVQWHWRTKSPTQCVLESHVTPRIRSQLEEGEYCQRRRYTAPIAQGKDKRRFAQHATLAKQEKGSLDPLQLHIQMTENVQARIARGRIYQALQGTLPYIKARRKHKAQEL